MGKKIAFIIPLYGKVPNYIKLFLKSAEYNKNHVFIFFTDLNLNYRLPDNIRKYDCSFVGFKQLIHSRTGVKPTFNSYYKIVDFKPAYGLIFQHYISEFDYWGMLDVDLILGKIDNFVTSELLENFDVISARKYWLSGSFAIFRNNEKVNTLFMKSDDWGKVFSSNKLCRFCETGTLRNTDKTLLNELRRGKSIYELDAQITSFTHILKDEAKLDGIFVHFNDLIKESINKNMVIGYKNGMVFIQDPGRSDFCLNQEFLHYHYVTEKSKIIFNYPKWKNVPNEFYITEYGFFKRTQFKYLLILKPITYLRGLVIFLVKTFPQKVRKKMVKYL